MVSFNSPTIRPPTLGQSRTVRRRAYSSVNSLRSLRPPKLRIRCALPRKRPVAPRTIDKLDALDVWTDELEEQKGAPNLALQLTRPATARAGHATVVLAGSVR